VITVTPQSAATLAGGLGYLMGGFKGLEIGQQLGPQLLAVTNKIADLSLQPAQAANQFLTDTFGSLLSPQKLTPLITPDFSRITSQGGFPPGPPPNYRIGDRPPPNLNARLTPQQSRITTPPSADGGLQQPYNPDDLNTLLRQQPLQPQQNIPPGEQGGDGTCPTCTTLSHQKGELEKSITTEQQQLQQQQVQQNEQQIQQFQQQENLQQQGFQQTNQQIENSIAQKLQLLQQINQQIANAKQQVVQQIPPGQQIPPELLQPSQGTVPSVQMGPMESPTQLPAPQPSMSPQQPQQSGHLNDLTPITFCITCASIADALKFQSGQGSENCELAQ